MFNNRWRVCGLVVFTVFFFLSVLEIDAWARAGGGRSSGSRGSRSYTPPRATPAPIPANPSQSGKQYGAPAAPAASPFGGGGFLRSVAGGIVGGMIGGMLFRSLGFAGGGEGGASGAGGGMGIMDFLLIGALLYGIYWFIKRRRSEAAATAPAGTYYRESSPAGGGQTALPLPAFDASRPDDAAAGLGHIRQMDPHFDEKRFTDGCMDQFFLIQGAWANRDMTSVRNILTAEMFGKLQEDAEQLKAQKQINRLENIAVRSVEITELWQEGGEDFITVRLTANLLDYTVDEQTGKVLSGSRTEPVKFNEYWTFTRPVGDYPWKLSAIHQAE